MAERVLVVEDEPLVQQLLNLNLTHAGYDVEAVSDYALGLAATRRGSFSLAIIDVMIPGGDGFQLTRAARDHGAGWPILMLTARNDIDSKVKGLDAGADDYLTKPFDVAELLARVRALLRRAQKAPVLTGRPKASVGKFWVRFDTGQALTNEGELSLSEKELRLMELFIGSENQALSRTDILEEVWGMDAFPTDRTVDNFILRLRRLFEPDPESPVHFITLRGKGYLFRG